MGYEGTVDDVFGNSALVEIASVNSCRQFGYFPSTFKRALMRFIHS